jgi:hypothetical protein
MLSFFRRLPRFGCVVTSFTAFSATSGNHKSLRVFHRPSENVGVIFESQLLWESCLGLIERDGGVLDYWSTIINDDESPLL